MQWIPGSPKWASPVLQVHKNQTVTHRKQKTYVQDSFEHCNAFQPGSKLTCNQSCKTKKSRRSTQNRRLPNPQETVILHLRTQSERNDCSKTRPSIPSAQQGSKSTCCKHKATKLFRTHADGQELGGRANVQSRMDRAVIKGHYPQTCMAPKKSSHPNVARACSSASSLPKNL